MSRSFSLCLVIALATLGCQLFLPRIEKELPETTEEIWEVRRIRSVPYYHGPEFDPVRHRLDLYIPRGRPCYPVLVLVHGGAWMVGDNRCAGYYSAIGEFLASRGIGTVMPNYRLSPAVQHPSHARDIARAVGWTRSCIDQYGGSTRNLYLAGHSAGGHLVALLGTDESYLRSEGVSLQDIRGIVAISGVYEIPPDSMSVALGGMGENSFQLRQVAPLRGIAGPGCLAPWGLPGIPLSLNVFGPAFGDDPQVREEASPIRHVRPGLPPFWILYAEHDLPTLPAMAQRFARVLGDHGNEVRCTEVLDRNHNSIIFQVIDSDDPVASGLLRFVREHQQTVGESGRRGGVAP